MMRDNGSPVFRFDVVEQIGPVMIDTLDAVLADASRVFCYDRDSRYQERAHDYLHERDVPRTPRDTACEAVVTDLCRRAYAAGALEDASSRVAAAMSLIAEDLVNASTDSAHDVQSC